MILQGFGVKIMKVNKDIAVPDKDLKKGIIELVQSRGTFQPEMSQIKEAVSLLLNTGYIKRDENDRTKYWYLA